MGQTKEALLAAGVFDDDYREPTPRRPLLPLYDEIRPGRDSYVYRSALPSLIPTASRWWRINGRTTSVQIGPSIIKSHNPFTEHTTADTFTALMQECYEIGVIRPSSYSDIFSQTYHTPWILPSASAIMGTTFAGGWQEARVLGMLKGPHFKYDLNSAYYWALLEGLPDPQTYRYSDGPHYSDTRGWQRHGIYVVSLERYSPSWPYPFNLPSLRYLASTHEIEHYGLPVKTYHYGISWDGLQDPTPMADHIKRLPAAKQVSRSYWGAWASRARVRCHSKNRQEGWDLRAVRTNLVWAHMIIARVKMRIWRAALKAAHVYVDSVITSETLPTGTEPGAWRLDATYPTGVYIGGTGYYGSSATQIDKHAGVTRK